MQILLVIVLGIVERFRGGDFGRHLARVARFTHGLLETLKAGARGGILLRRERINGRAILCAVVVALTHALRRVVVLPEDLQQLFVADYRRVIDHAHRFRMPGFAGADFAIGRIRRVTARVASRRAVNAGELPEEALNAPETAHGEQGDFHSLRHVGHGVVIDGV